MGYADPRSEQPSRQAPFEMNEMPAVRRLSVEAARAYLLQPVLPAEPVVLTAAMEGCPAMRKWTPEFFRSRYAGLEYEVKGRSITLGEQLSLIETSTEEHPAPYPYNLDVVARLPELLPDLQPTLKFGRTDRTFHPLVPRAFTGGTIIHELFFGGRGSTFPQLHYDVLAMHTQITQIHGEKEFFLFDPSQTPMIYPEPNDPRISRIPNIFTVDLLQFPAFRNARVTRVLLHQGETLFFPTGWWHTTRMYGPSITYGRIVLNASNWNKVLREKLADWRAQHPTFAWPAYAYGRFLGGVLSALDALG